MPTTTLTPELEEAALEEVHVATMKMLNAMEDRDAAICRAHTDGVALSAIAASANLTRQRVWQIVNH